MLFDEGDFRRDSRVRLFGKSKRFAGVIVDLVWATSFR